MDRKSLLLVFVSILAASAVPAGGCTLFSASGSKFVQGGGSLIAKTRDWTPDYNDVRVYSPRGKNRFWALVAGDTPYKMSPRCGINEKGLAVVTASAGSVPRQELMKIPGKRNYVETTLTNCNSVEDAIRQLEPRRGMHFILADKKETAVVEFSPDGFPSVTRTSNGTLRHTNHYVDKQFIHFNRKIGASSLARWERISWLLMSTKKPFSIDDFIGFTRDQNSGPDNSIFRTGSKKTSARTQAMLVIYLPPTGSPQIDLQIYKDPSRRDSFEKLRLETNSIFK